MSEQSPRADRTGSRPGQAGEVSGSTRSTAAKPGQRPDGWRETIESIVVAFLLTFLFRTFEAEAFVIPTGSMAPTLYGQHRDVYCEKCGTRFAVGVSSVPAPDAEVRDGWLSPGDRTHFAVCPNANCRFPNKVLDREMFAGDRILVNKFPFEFRDPERWEIVVFKYPDGAKTNYIKRLVGKPGESIRLIGGDVRVRPAGSDRFEIARKPPDKQRHLQILVHDNDHPANELLQAGWPEAWASFDGTSWVSEPRDRAFHFEPDAAAPEGLHWLRYTHYVPSGKDWSDALKDLRPAAPQPGHIRDFYAYNAAISVREAEGPVASDRLPVLTDRDEGMRWVGDLTLNGTVEVQQSAGDLVLELVKANRRNRCTIDLATGTGELSYLHEMNREEDEVVSAGGSFETPLWRPGRYQVSFANVDERLCVWINDRLVKEVEFSDDPLISDAYRAQPPPLEPTERDKSPVGIAARGARLRISHLSIERDIYYINEGPGGQSDVIETYTLRDSSDDLEDEFLMLGDNSPRSNDSRLWQHSRAVPRRLLIGKAFFIYWPHAVPFLNDWRGFPLMTYAERHDPAHAPVPRVSLPFYPQVGRMNRIR